MPQAAGSPSKKRRKQPAMGLGSHPRQLVQIFHERSRQSIHIQAQGRLSVKTVQWAHTVRLSFHETFMRSAVQPMTWFLSPWARFVAGQEFHHSPSTRVWISMTPLTGPKLVLGLVRLAR